MNEVDQNGHPMCGASFMAGTICSDKPGHSGGHSCVCQECGGDWMNGTCTCRLICVNCGAYCDDDGADWNATLCYDCEVDEHGAHHDCDECGNLVAGFDINVQHAVSCSLYPSNVVDPNEPTPAELAEVYRSLGAVPPNQ